MATKRTKKTLGRAAVGITIVALAAVGLLGYRAAAGTSNNTNHYRTVTAAAGTVTQVLSLSGTVHHVTQASVSFPTSGMVTAVNVRAGDTVTAGQALASINSTPLQNAVLAADAAYKSAISQYQTDQQTYASSSTTTSSTTKAATSSTSRQAAAGTSSSQASSGAPSGTGTPSGGGTGGTGAPGGSTDPAAAVKAATDAIAALQTGVQTVETALPIFIAECIPLIPTTTASPVATVTKTVTVTVTVTHTATVTVTASGNVAAAAASVGAAATRSAAASSTAPSASAAATSAKPKATAAAAASTPVTAKCQAAIDTLTASNTTLPGQMTAANVALAAALKALDAQAATLQQEAATLQKQQQASQAAAASGQAAAAKQQSSTLSSTNSALQAAAAAGLSRTGVGSVTAATLITDQSTIQSSAIALAQAQDQLNQATITSPIAGKVASMPFIVGQQASATAAAVIIGTGAIEVTVPVPLAKRAQVATGQAATVTSTIGGTTLAGTISRISLLPTTTTGFSVTAGAGSSTSTGAGSSTSTGANSSSTQSTTTYATVITITSGGDLLPENSRVGATITTKTVSAGVVLPASAVTPTGTGSGTVQVITNGILSTKRVVTGALGDKDIEIVSGVTAGEAVVIADVDKPIPGASIAASRGGQTAQQQQFPNGGGATDVPTGGGATGGAQPPAGGAPPT
jgi:multidrug efflux pump subunit AcrA (membrane-fusion protein)